MQGFGPRAIRAHRLGAELREVGLEVRVPDRVLQGGVQAVHHALRRALGHIQPVPHHDLESLQPLLVERRDVRQRGYAFLAGDSIRLHLAALDLAGGVGGLVAHEIDLPAQEIVHRRRRALVGDGGEVCLDRRHEQEAAQVRGCSQARVRVGDLVLVRFDIGEELLEVRGREVAAGDHRHRHVGHLADVLEILERIESERPVQRGRSRHPDVVQQHGVAVRRSLRCACDRDGAARPDDVLDDQLLLERSAHHLREIAPERVGRPARRERYVQVDRFGRIALPQSARRHGERRECQQSLQFSHA